MTFPWPCALPSSDDIARHQLDRLSASVAVASGLAATGRHIDLAGLDAVAGVLCAQVLDLLPQEGSAIRPALVALNDRMAALAWTLRGQTAS